MAKGVYTGSPVYPAVSAQDPARPGLPWFWLALVTVAILYGSLIPFDLDLATLGETGCLRLSPTPLAGVNREDIATNLLLYVPVGIMATLCGHRRDFSSIVCFLLALGYGLTLSLGVETLQAASASRVASRWDVACNLVGVAGGALGVLLWHRRARDTWRSLGCAMKQRPFGTVSVCLALGLLAFNLLPFDFVTSSAELHDSFRQAHWGFLPPLASSDHARPFEAIVGQVRGAGWFALLGFVVALAQRESRRISRTAFGLAVVHTLTIVVLVELLELFTVTQVFSLGVIVIRCVGALTGAWVGVFVVDSNTASAWLGHNRQAVPTVPLLVAGAIQLLLILLAAVDFPVDTGIRGTGLSFAGLPFEALWHGSMVRAAQIVLAIVGIYGSLALTFGELIVCIRWPRPRLSVVVMAGLVAISVEVLKTATSAHFFDLTTPILAVLTVAMTSRLHAGLCDLAGRNRDDGCAVWTASMAPAATTRFAEYEIHG